MDRGQQKEVRADRAKSRPSEVIDKESSALSKVEEDNEPEGWECDNCLMDWRDLKAHLALLKLLSSFAVNKQIHHELTSLFWGQNVFCFNQQSRVM